MEGTKHVEEKRLVAPRSTSRRFLTYVGILIVLSCMGGLMFLSWHALQEYMTQQVTNALKKTGVAVLLIGLAASFFFSAQQKKLPR